MTPERFDFLQAARDYGHAAWLVTARDPSWSGPLTFERFAGPDEDAVDVLVQFEAAAPAARVLCLERLR